MSSFEESEEYKAAKEAHEKKSRRPSVRNVIERYIDADNADHVSAAIKRGDIDYDDAVEMGLNVSKAAKPKADGDGDDDGDEGEEEEEERGPRRRSGYFGRGDE